MSRYIDAEWLLNFFEPYPNDYQTPLGSLRACVDDAPSIDIIRCGECKHRKPSVCVGSIKIYECDITGFRMHDLTNHFCSYGERLE